MTCRFELKVKRTNLFHCAVRYGLRGWAYLWQHNDMQDPCVKCPVKIIGKPLEVEREIPSGMWSSVAGKRIRAEDWIEFERRGYKVTPKGIEKDATK